jgi:hypothetical protein
VGEIHRRLQRRSEREQRKKKWDAAGHELCSFWEEVALLRNRGNGFFKSADETLATEPFETRHHRLIQKWGCVSADDFRFIAPTHPSKLRAWRRLRHRDWKPTGNFSVGTVVGFG